MPGCDTTLRAAGTAAPTTRRQREPGGGGEDASGYPRRASASCTFPSSRSAACPPPPAAAAAAWSFSASSRRRRWCRRCRSTNYIRATRPRPPSGNLGSFRHSPPLPPSAFLPTPRGSGTSPSANLGAGPGASGLRGVGAAFGRRTVGREGRHRGLNAERRRLRVRPEAQRRRGRGALGESAAAPAPRLRAGVGKPLIGRRADGCGGAAAWAGAEVFPPPATGTGTKRRNAALRTRARGAADGSPPGEAGGPAGSRAPDSRTLLRRLHFPFLSGGSSSPKENSFGDPGCDCLKFCFGCLVEEKLQQALLGVGDIRLIYCFCPEHGHNGEIPSCVPGPWPLILGPSSSKKLSYSY
ncbi:uncharacterized protein LOC103748011 [Nannospalax galili]|uniref:uncharacterized protein LOC103748011 n=1 Tax=Nannospalax galili TaxID=1026970 RepID=UPI00111C6F2F|nr:uncharacterized protein LOC103748011 [Nannospalax galili]